MTGTPILIEAMASVERGDADVVLDFSAVKRVEPVDIRALENLTILASGKSVRLVLRAVPVEVYRVLKLLKMANRFTFET